MTSIDLSHHAYNRGITTLVRQALRRFGRRAAAPESSEDACARRAFVQEMLNRNPGAFSSDLDVQSMMQHYPESF
jgi:hypothetical protein